MKYGYARVSAAVQLKGNSLDDQIEDLKQAGVSAENIIAEQYSGATAARPGFQKLLSRLKSGDELVCCKLDRFARNVEDGLKVVRELRERGISIRILNISNGQPFDNSSMGQLLFTILLAFAQFERNMILERTAEGRAAARKQPGYREGRPRIPKKKIDLALGLLASHSYSQVVEMTGISKATLHRYAAKQKIEELERLKAVPRRGSQGPEDEMTLDLIPNSKRPGRRPGGKEK